jgi:MFS family permease
MDISEKEAQYSLDQIQSVATHTRRTLAASYDSVMLMMWGLIWILGFLGTHFFLRWVWWIWMVLGGIGGIATFLYSWRQFRSANPIKVPAAEKIGWRIFLFWSLLFVYIFIWLSILKPGHGIQLNAFICTAIMFAYIVTGLWFKYYYMLWLGIVVTCTTLVGYYLIPTSYYCLWMALTGGGAIFGTGLYIRIFWK